MVRLVDLRFDWPGRVEGDERPGLTTDNGTVELYRDRRAFTVVLGNRGHPVVDIEVKSVDWLEK